jgi:hypothetical protein
MFKGGENLRRGRENLARLSGQSLRDAGPFVCEKGQFCPTPKRAEVQGRHFA